MSELANKTGELLLEARHISKRFGVAGGRQLTACNDISLNLYRGRTLGLVGESGCGKSTFMRLLVQLEKPTSGEIIYRGQNIAHLSGARLRENRQHIQMIFQDPYSSFNPRMRVRDILCEPLLNFKRIKKSECAAKAAELLEMVNLPPSFMERYPHSMSGGQRQRVAIARALALEPEILICDEATAALDPPVQQTIIQLLVRLQQEKQLAVGFIAHDLALIAAFAHQVAVMYLGSVVELLPGEQVKNARHPYSRSLLEAVLDLNMDFHKEIPAQNCEIPSPLAVPQGCPFQTRCPHCQPICRSQRPALQAVEAEHFVACHLL